MEYKVTEYIKTFSKDSPFRSQFEQIESAESGYTSYDPLGEDNYRPKKCIVHRYPNKVLFLVTQDCAAHCAFCTRQRLCGVQYTTEDIDSGLSYIQNHTEIIDVLISGGDPLVVPEITKRCLSEIQFLDHVKWVRIGTRLPIVNPEEALRVIKGFPEIEKPLYINIHINHPDEITDASKQVLKEMRMRGYILGSQSVILKGINDNEKTLQELFIKITEVGVRPYYAYVTDQVKGTERFWVDPEKCMTLFSKLRGLPGLCLPKLVWDDSAGKIYLPEYEIFHNEDVFMGIGFNKAFQLYKRGRRND